MARLVCLLLALLTGLCAAKSHYKREDYGDTLSDLLGDIKKEGGNVKQIDISNLNTQELESALNDALKDFGNAGKRDARQYPTQGPTERPTERPTARAFIKQDTKELIDALRAYVGNKEARQYTPEPTPPPTARAIVRREWVNVTKKDYGNVTKKDWGNITKKDTQELIEALRAYAGNRESRQYSTGPPTEPPTARAFLKREWGNFTKKDWGNFTKKDWGNATKRGFDKLSSKDTKELVEALRAFAGNKESRHIYTTARPTAPPTTRRFFLKRASYGSLPAGSCGMTINPWNGAKKRTLASKLKDLLKRVMGGSQVGSSTFPWLADLTINGARSVGVIVSDWWILTAGLNVEQSGQVMSNPQISVKVGTNNLNTPERGVQTFQGVKVVVNQMMFFGGGSNGRKPAADIAMIKLNRQMTFTDWVQPICVSPQAFSQGTMCASAGWGMTGRGGVTSAAMGLNMQIVACGRESNGEICAKAPRNRLADLCDGDVGAPLMCKRGGVYYVAGLKTTGMTCAQELASGRTIPSGFATISDNYKFISDTVKGQ